MMCLLHSHITVHILCDRHYRHALRPKQIQETLFGIFLKKVCNVPVIPLVTASIIANKLSLCSFHINGRRDLSGDPQQSTNTSNWNVLVFK